MEAAGWLDFVVVVGFGLAAIYLGALRPIWTWPCLLAFAMAFSFWVEIGTRWTPAKVAPLVFAAFMVPRRALTPHAGARVRLPSWWLVLVGLMLIDTAAQIWLRLDLLTRYPGAARSVFQAPSGRAFVQLGAYLVAALYYLISKSGVAKRQHFDQFARCYLAASTCLAAYGVYQLIAHYFNLPYRGIWYASDVEGFGAFAVQGVVIPRLNSLANEPKQLALFLLPAISLLILAGPGVRVRLGYFGRAWNLLLHASVFVLTFSASGFLSAGLAVPLVLGLVTLSNAVRSTRVYVISSLAAGTSIAVVGGLVGAEVIGDAFSVRTWGVLEQNRLEYSVLDYVLADGRIVLFGLGPGIYNFALDAAGVQTTSEWGVDPLTSGLLTLVADFGLLGVIVILGLVAIPTLREAYAQGRISNGEDRARLVMASALVVTAMAQLPFSGSLSHLFMFSGICAGLVRSLK